MKPTYSYCIRSSGILITETAKPFAPERNMYLLLVAFFSQISFRFFALQTARAGERMRTDLALRLVGAFASVAGV